MSWLAGNWISVVCAAGVVVLFFPKGWYYQ